MLHKPDKYAAFSVLLTVYFKWKIFIRVFLGYFQAIIIRWSNRPYRRWKMHLNVAWRKKLARLTQFVSWSATEILISITWVLWDQKLVIKFQNERPGRYFWLDNADCIAIVIFIITEKYAIFTVLYCEGHWAWLAFVKVNLHWRKQFN